MPKTYQLKSKCKVAILTARDYSYPVLLGTSGFLPPRGKKLGVRLGHCSTNFIQIMPGMYLVTTKRHRLLSVALLT